MTRSFLAAAALFAVAVVVRAEDKDVVKVDAEVFAVDVKKDEKAAASKYKGKAIQMTAAVQSLNRNASGDVFLSLPSKTAGILGVSCFLKDRNVFGKIVKGQEVTVRGRYPDIMFGVQIMDCEVVRTGKSPALTYTAEEFAKEWAADKKSAGEKWKDKPIIVSGEVVDTKANDVGAISVWLKAADGKRVDAGFSAFEKDLASKIKKGDKVKVVGEFIDFESKDEGPALRFCWPVKE